MNAESVLLVPGSWHGAWAYDDVADRLTRAGVVVTAIDLPSNGGTAGLTDDAAAVRSALEAIGAPTVVVGHSCEEDRAVPPPVQEAMSARAGTVRRVASSHSPFLSRPGDVTGVVLQQMTA